MLVPRLDRRRRRGGARVARRLGAEARRGRGCGARARRAGGAQRLLHGAPALHALTRRRAAAAGRPELDPSSWERPVRRIIAAVARVAVALGREGQRLAGEHELRALERAAGRPLASAEVGYARRLRRAAPARPRLLGDGLPVAVEVELTVKAPERLLRDRARLGAQPPRRRRRLLRDAGGDAGRGSARSARSRPTGGSCVPSALASTSSIPSAP